MNRDEILQLVTDSLCGELDRDGRAVLEAALAADPALAAEADRLVMAWQGLEVLREEGLPEEEALARVWNRILQEDPSELSEDDLDLAAGGISPADGLPWPEDPEGGGNQ